MRTITAFLRDEGILPSHRHFFSIALDVWKCCVVSLSSELIRLVLIVKMHANAATQKEQSTFPKAIATIERLEYISTDHLGVDTLNYRIRSSIRKFWGFSWYET